MATSVKGVISFNGNDIESAVKSYSGSKKYIRKFFGYCVINILYNRVQIPKEEFELFEMKDCDIKFMLNKRSSKHKVISAYNSWMKGALDALDREYLKEFYLLIKNKEDVLREYFKFSFCYNKAAQKKGNTNKTMLYEQTKQILNEIELLSSWEKWDTKDNIFTVELVYSDKVPLTYSAPNFNRPEGPTQSEKIEKMLQQKKLKFRSLNTNFHSLKCHFQSEKAMVPEEDSNLLACFHSEDTEQIELAHKIRLSDDDNSSPSTKRRKISIQASSSESKKETYPEGTDNNQCTFCVCESNVTHEALEIVYCILCKKPYHSACFGFFTVARIQKDFNCVACGGNLKLPRTADNVVANRVNFCRRRLLFAFCYLTNQIPSKSIMDGFPEEDRNTLWDDLNFFRIIVKKDEKYVVNQARIAANSLFKSIFPDEPQIGFPDSLELVDLTEE